MPAAKLDIDLEEHSNLEMKVVYYDDNGNAIDISNYGATMVFAEAPKKEILFKATVNDGEIAIEGVSGTVLVNIPFSYYKNLPVKKGVYQLYIHATVGDVEDNPRRLLEGNFLYSRTLL